MIYAMIEDWSFASLTRLELLAVTTSLVLDLDFSYYTLLFYMYTYILCGKY